MGRLIVLIWFIFLCHCSATTRDPVEKAVEIHNLAVKISEHVAKKIESIEAAAYRSTGPDRSALLDSAKQLSQDLAVWKSSLVEVPGYEHGHEEHHDHHHQPPPDLTPDMILEIQKALRGQIIQLNIRSQRILDQVNKTERSI